MESSSASDARYWCPLRPCCPCDPVTIDGRLVHMPQVAGGMSFATMAAYDRHLTMGHFTPPSAGPRAIYARRGQASEDPR